MRRWVEAMEDFSWGGRAQGILLLLGCLGLGVGGGLGWLLGDAGYGAGLGGLLAMIGWFALVVAAIRRGRRHDRVHVPRRRRDD